MADASTSSAEAFAQRAIDFELIEPRDLNDIRADLGTQDFSFEKLQSELLRRELLTNFQIERMQRGEKQGYHYGNYKVLYLVESSDGRDRRR